MKRIVITPEQNRVDEHIIIERLFANGLERLHLRKPNATEEEYRQYIRLIPLKWHNRLVLHDHFILASKFEVGGIHLNRRNNVPPKGYSGSVSRSCHSMDELAGLNADYCFLSPVFNSLSKKGYEATFSPELLMTAKEQGIINERVMALGGITPDNLHQVRQWGFGGVAVLGYLWEAPSTEKLMERWSQLRAKL